MGDCRAQNQRRLSNYLQLADSNPELFENPNRRGYRLLTKEPEIDRAMEAERQQLEQGGQPAEWSWVGLVYEDQYIRILRDAVEFPDGRLGTYIRILCQEGLGAGVAILPKFHEKIVLLRHHRHATRSWHLEIPRGFGVEDLDGEENARRELAEELGAKARMLVPLGPLQIDSGLGALTACLYLADVPAIGTPGTAEAIDEVLFVAVEELEEMISTERVTDSFTIAAYTRARLKGLL